MASVSVVGNHKLGKDVSNEQFVQGLEKLSLAMTGRPYMGLIIAENQSSQSVEVMRKTWQDLYTRLSPYQKLQFSDSTSSSTAKSKSFAEMDGKQKAAMLGSALVSLAGVAGGAVLGSMGVAGGAAGSAGATLGSVGAVLGSVEGIGGASVGSMIGGQIGGQFSAFVNSLAPSEQVASGTTQTMASTIR